MAWTSSPIHHRVGEQKTGLPPFFLSIPLLLFTPSHVYSLSHTWTFPFLPFLILTIKHSTLIPLVCFFFTRTHSPPACLPLPHPPTPSPPFFFSPRIPAFFPFHLSRTTPLSSFPIGIVQSKRRMNTILQTSKGILSLCCCRRRLAFLSYDPQSSNVLNAVITVLVAPFKPPFKVTRGIFLISHVGILRTMRQNKARYLHTRQRGCSFPSPSLPFKCYHFRSLRFCQFRNVCLFGAPLSFAVVVTAA